jgi:hypothetical protein
MNTVGLLEFEYREVEKLFFRIANASGSEMRTRLFEELADHLAAYAAMEDRMQPRSGSLPHTKRRSSCSSH